MRIMRPGPICWCVPAALIAGCATTLPDWLRPSWTPGYEDAARAARADGRGMLVLYRNTDQGVQDAMFDALRTHEVETRTKDAVTCLLFQSHEPDRRFVAQYGVERAPALILIHPDGTYHARTGTQSSEQIAAFLDAAVPPGAEPKRNPHLLRQPVYAWHPSLDSARRAARSRGQSILLVLDRGFTRDWERLRPMLERREVYARFADMVHCRPSSLWGQTQAARKEYAVAALPALVIIRPDGSHRALELPTSYETIVRFADSAQAEPSGDESAAAQGAAP
jgi:hypothetical protein